MLETLPVEVRTAGVCGAGAGLCNEEVSAGEVGGDGDHLIRNSLIETGLYSTKTIRRVLKSFLKDRPALMVRNV